MFHFNDDFFIHKNLLHRSYFSSVNLKQCKKSEFVRMEKLVIPDRIALFRNDKWIII